MKKRLNEGLLKNRHKTLERGGVSWNLFCLTLGGVASEAPPCGNRYYAIFCIQNMIIFSDFKDIVIWHCGLSLRGFWDTLSGFLYP